MYYSSLKSSFSTEIYLENGEWGTRGPLWGLGAMGSREEGFSLFVVRETHGSLAPVALPARGLNPWLQAKVVFRRLDKNFSPLEWT